MSENIVLPTSQSHPQDTKAPEIPFDFKEELSVFRQLLTEFGAEVEATKIRRDLRANRKNVAELRQQGILLPDETIIPDRTIEQNCQTEIIPYIAFTEQPNQVVSFHDPANPGFDYNPYADWITSVMRYEDWQRPWQPMEDCMILHGAAFFEVIFDESSPAKYAFEYVRREHFIIPRDTKDIQACLRLARVYEITKHQLSLLAAAFGFNPSVVEKIKEHYKSKTEFIRIYKYFLRDENNYVYNAWFADPDIGCDAWLREPMPHFLGDYSDPAETLPGLPPAPPSPQPTTIYPFVDFPYRTQEDEAILLVQGQAALSVHCQEAMTGLLSATVNGCTRAAGIYAGQDPAPGTNGTGKELFPLKSGYVHDAAINFFSPPWPNAIALSVAQVLSVRNASQQGQTDFAAMSRNDTAKRATEIVAAKEESDKLKTARLSLFSSRCLRAYKIAFKIILNQIKIGGLIPPPNLDVSVLFSPTLILTMAADTQVVKRDQRKQKLLDLWPVVQTTPLAPVYFEAMMMDLFPDDWPLWKSAMMQNQQSAQPLQLAADTMQQIFPSITDPAAKELLVNTLNQLGPMLQLQPQNATTNPAQPVAG